ncbi:MAG: hypothetical protein CMF74_19145 [Maricaulis sp.]|nr:hypothetical protein [Maricaulis sp.]
MSGYFKTIGDLERATYGLGSDNLLKATGATTGIAGGHHTAAGLAGAGGDKSLYNLVYGQKVWTMINREINALSILPKKPWRSSGWRIMKERAIGGSADTFSVSDLDDLGGTAENAALSGITNVKPVYENLHVSPKTIAHTFEISEIAQLMAGLDDGLGDLIATYREEVGVSHAESMNKMILQDLTAVAGTGIDAHATKADNSLMSLFKIVATHAETNALSTYTTNKNNLYGVARDGTSATEYLESYVDSNSGTERNLTVNILNTAIRNLMARGGEPKVILTGYDTIQTLGELLQAQERFMGRTEITPTHNGIKGVEGREVGFRVATYHDIPIIPVKDMPNGGAGISDVLILDTDHLFLCTLKPTEYFEGGINADVFGHGKLGHRGLYRTVAEVVCSYFRGQGKLLDLQ